MSDSITIFKNDEFGAVRTVTNEEGITLYCASDVAKALGYVKPNNAINTHCKGTPILCPLQTSGGMQQVRFIGKSNVIRLITHSTMEKAQEFEKWLFEDIAPKAIDGDLIPRDQVLAMFSDPDTLLQFVTTWKQDRDRAIALEVENENLKPKALVGEALTLGDREMSIGTLAKYLTQAGFRIGQNNLFKLLRTDDYLMVRDGDNVPTQKAMELKVFAMTRRSIEKPSGEKITRTTTRVTPKGIRYFIEKYAGQKSLEV